MSLVQLIQRKFSYAFFYILSVKCALVEFQFNEKNIFHGAADNLNKKIKKIVETTYRMLLWYCISGVIILSLPFMKNIYLNLLLLCAVNYGLYIVLPLFYLSSVLFVPVV